MTLDQVPPHCGRFPGEGLLAVGIHEFGGWALAIFGAAVVLVALLIRIDAAGYARLRWDRRHR